MKTMLLASALLATVPLSARAEDGKWSGSGELGFAMTRGNTESENLNAKLQFKKEDDVWKHNFFLNALRSKGTINNSYDVTANRYDAGVSSGFKLDERSYIVGATRYENDDFSTYEYQLIVSLGYGYTAIKNERTELSLEIGPGYRRTQRRPFIEQIGDPPEPVLNDPDADGQAVGRGLIAFKHQITATTAFENTLLVETGSDNTFVQNNAGLAVSMNDKLALKLGFQVRHNTDVQANSEKTDQLLTTNLVYKF